MTDWGSSASVIDFPGALFMSAGGYHHHLGTNTWAAGAPPAGEGDARLLEWIMRLSGSGELDAAVRSLGGRRATRPARGGLTPSLRIPGAPICGSRTV